MLRVCTDMEMGQKRFPFANMNLNTIQKMIENFCCDGLIDITPIDGFGRRGLVDNKTILWRATSARSSFNDNGAIAGEFSFSPVTACSARPALERSIRYC